MKMVKTIVVSLTAIAGALLSQESMALQAGDNLLYLGGAYVMPSGSISPLSSRHERLDPERVDVCVELLPHVY
jgi:outer membrane protein W